jgi:hypothetical protein
MGLELKRVLEPFFPKKIKLIIIHPFPVFSLLLLYFGCSKNICNPLFCMSNDTKINQFGQETRMHWKLPNDK